MFKNWLPYYHDAPTKVWKDICFSSNMQNQIAVTSGGGIHTSQDSGDSFYYVVDPNPEAFKRYRICRISATGEMAGVLTLDKSECLRSTNYGINWSVLNLSAVSEPYVSSMDMTGDGRHWVLVSSTAPSTPGSIYVSTNYGLTFSKVFPSEVKVWTSVCTTPNIAFQFYAASNSHIMTSVGFSSGMTNTGSPVMDWLSVKCSSSGGSVVARTLNSLWISLNYGTDWHEITPPDITTFGNDTNIEISNDGNIILLTYENKVYHSVDNGLTWGSRIVSAEGTFLGPVVISDDGYWVYCGEVNGSLWKGEIDLEAITPPENDFKAWHQVRWVLEGEPVQALPPGAFDQVVIQSLPDLRMVYDVWVNTAVLQGRLNRLKLSELSDVMVSGIQTGQTLGWSSAGWLPGIRIADEEKSSQTVWSSQRISEIRLDDLSDVEEGVFTLRQVLERTATGWRPGFYLDDTTQGNNAIWSSTKITNVLQALKLSSLADVEPYDNAPVGSVLALSDQGRWVPSTPPIKDTPFLFGIDSNVIGVSPTSVAVHSLVEGMAVDLSGSILYLKKDINGIYRSIDGGKTTELLHDTIFTNDVVIHTDITGKIVLVYVIESNVVKSQSYSIDSLSTIDTQIMDSIESWKYLNSSMSANGVYVCLALSDNETELIHTFSIVNMKFKSGNVIDVDYPVTQSSLSYNGREIAYISNSTLFTSFDSGISWEENSLPNVSHVDVSLDGKLLFAVSGLSPNRIAQVSADMGQTWNTIFDQEEAISIISFLNGFGILIKGITKHWVSFDFGNTWSEYGTSGLMILPSESGRKFLVLDSGTLTIYSGEVQANHQFQLDLDLVPTSDPGRPGVIWRDGTTLKVSV